MKEVLDLGDANLMEQDFYVEVKQILNSAREKVYKTANFAMVEAYWNIGKCIVEKQGGKDKAEYGTQLIKNLSVRMVKEFGKGFTPANLANMRQFYLEETVKSNWSTRQLERQINSFFYERLLSGTSTRKAYNTYLLFSHGFRYNGDSNHIRGLHIHVLHHDHVHDDYISRLDCMLSFHLYMPVLPYLPLRILHLIIQYLPLSVPFVHHHLCHHK